jgi:hypothetical protein
MVQTDVILPFDQQPKATQTVIDSRNNLCVVCPESQEKPDRCNKCGCTISIITQVEHARCPLNKW